MNMNDGTSKTRQYKKRKQGKNKNMIVEGDNDAFPFITFEAVTTNSPAGPITEWIQVPLKCMPEHQDSHTPAQMIVDPPTELFNNDLFSMTGQHDREQAIEGQTKNKVILNVYFTWKKNNKIHPSNMHGWKTLFAVLTVCWTRSSLERHCHRMAFAHVLAETGPFGGARTVLYQHFFAGIACTTPMPQVLCTKLDVGLGLSSALHTSGRLEYTCLFLIIRKVKSANQ